MKESNPMQNLFSLIKNQRWVFMCAVITAMICGSIYMYMTPEEYTSKATIHINAKEQHYGNIKLFPSSRTHLTEEITSVPFLAEALKENKGLVRHYIIQDFRKESATYRFPYEITYRVSGNPNFTEQVYQVAPINSTTYQLTSTIHGIKRIKNGTFGEELIDNNVTLTINKKKTTPMVISPLIMGPVYCFVIESPVSLAMKLSASNKLLSVSDDDGLITIECRSDHPDHVKEITTAISNKLMGLITENNKSNLNTPQIIQLDMQIESISNQLSETEQQIAQFKKSNNITELDFDTEKSLAVMKELQLQKTQLEMKMSALDNLSTYLRKNRDGDNSMAEYGAIDDPRFSEQMALLNQKYQDKKSGTANNTTDTDIENIKSSIAERILNTRKRTAIQIEGLQHAIRANQRNLSSIPEKASALMALDRKLQLDKKVYELLSDKRAQAIVDLKVPAVASRMLKPATTPMSPSAPNAWLILGICLAAGMIIGWPIAVLNTHRMAMNIRKREQIDELQTIPFMGSIETGNSLSTSVNNLCTKMMMREHIKMVTFASAGNFEGKSFIASRLGQALSAMDKKVLLLDMNMLHPEFPGIYQSAPTHSMADVISGTCDIHDAICLTSYPNLELLIAGELSSGINTLISSPKKNEIFETLKNHYDFILINTPGLSHYIDAIPMMKMCDFNMFIVKANTTRKHSLLLAEQVKKDYEIENFYCLLNNHSENKQERKSRVRTRNININKNETDKTSFVPRVMRRIALWFY